MKTYVSLFLVAYGFAVLIAGVQMESVAVTLFGGLTGIIGGLYLNTKNA